MALRSWRGQARMVVDEVVRQALTSDTGVDMVLTALDVAFQHLEDEEVPDASEKGLYSTVRDRRRRGT